jgi:hypothetical protein
MMWPVTRIVAADGVETFFAKQDSVPRGEFGRTGLVSKLCFEKPPAPASKKTMRSGGHQASVTGADSATASYASHALEHLYPEEARRLIREAFRALREGGILRVVVADLKAIVQEYLGGRPFGELSGEFASLRPADRVDHRLLMHWATPPSGNLLYRIYNSWQDFHSHKWMHDSDSLISLFQAAGFAEAERKGCPQSRIDDIARVEEKSRILQGAGVCVEAVKPLSTGWKVSSGSVQLRGLL